MNKRIAPLLLCFVMVFAMLATAVPTFAEGTTNKGIFTVKADKTSANPGDVINVTLILTPPSGKLTAFQGFFQADTGLTYVANSGKIPDGLKASLGFDSVDWTELSKMVNGYGSTVYAGTADIVLAELRYKVDDNAAVGSVLKISLDEIEVCDQTTDLVESAVIPATITVTAAPKPATGISLNKSALTLTAGSSDASLTANVTPSDSTDTVVWSTNKPAVATVESATGKVTAVAPGEAIITAKAGTKTATCTVTVTCAHSSLRPVAEKASNCTEKGWDAYKKCSLCGKLFDMNGNLISEIPYRALNNDHDFNTSEWGYKGPDGHAHTCSRNAEHHDAVQAHTPDHEGGATYNYAVKCSVCNYVIEPQLEAGNIRIEVPFKLTVKKTGEMDPGKETFKFALERFGATTEYTVVQDTVETDGEKTYDGKFVFTISANQAGNLSEGFVIRQVKGNAEGWTYDETKFYAMPMFADTYTNVAGWRFLKYDENAEFDYNNPIEEIGFTNSYNAKKPVTPPAPQKPESPKPESPKTESPKTESPKTESPKTGDSNMAGLWIALLFVSAASLTGTTLYSRKKRANNR